MRHVLKLTKSGGSLSFNVGSLISKEQLTWHAGDYFQIARLCKNEFVITKLDLRERAFSKKKSAPTNLAKDELDDRLTNRL